MLALVSNGYGQTDLVAENIGNLKASNVLVRRRAVVALGESGDGRAIEPLIAAFGDRDADVKRTAVSALARIGAPAVEPLIRALNHPHNDGIEAYEVDALANIGVPAIQPLSSALKNTQYSVRRLAAHALAKIGAPAIESLLVALRDSGFGGASPIAQDALALIGAPAVEPLLAVLREPGFQWPKHEAAQVLARIGRPAVKPLLAALNDPDGDVRDAAAQALGWPGNTDAVEPLVAALRAQQVGIYAVDALGKIKDQRAVEGLIFVLGRGDIEAAYAARALGELRDPRAVAPLVSVLKNTQTQYTREGVRGEVGQRTAASAEALAKLGAVEPLITALTDANEPIRGSAAAALKESTDPRAISSLLAALERRDIVVVAAAFKFGSSEEFVGKLRLG